MPELEAGLLPIGGAVLASDARVLEAVRATGARTGVDYTDDTAVSALLAERRQAAHAAQHRPLAWVAGLALVAVVCWVVTAVSVPALGPMKALFAGPFLIVAVAALVHVRRGWRRVLLHPALAGYREILGVARAHGLPLAHVPAWLEGKPEGAGGNGKAVLPIPSYPTVDPAPAAGGGAAFGAAPQAFGRPVPPVPPKPAAVSEYERIADAGGWHDEGGCLLILAGAGGALWAATDGTPIGYGALVLIPLAVIVWLAGRRQGDEKAHLRAEAVAYVQAVAAAQAAGAQVPELSPVLRKLLDGAYDVP
jgi:hypothetical protein